jgi:hypothetical protein
MIERLNNAIKEAMKSQDKFRLEVLRMMKSKILVVDARGNVPEAEGIKILRKYAKSIQETLDQQKQFNRVEEAAGTEKELKIVLEFLPAELDGAALEKIVKDAVAKTGASSMKDMGMVMKEIMASNQGVEGGKVKDIIAKALA